MSKKDDEKRKKATIAIVAAAVAMLAIGLAILMNNARHNAPKTVNKKAPIKTITPASQLVEQSWVAKAQKQIQQQQRLIQELRQKQKQQQQELERLRKEKLSNSLPKITNENKQSKTNPFPSYPPAPKINVNYKQPSRFSLNSNKEPVNNFPENPTIIGGIAEASPENIQNTQPKQTQNTQKTTKPNSVNPALKQTLSSPKGERAAKTNKPKQKPIVIPPGSFVKAVLLSGADVPTMGNGSVGPIPVIFRVVDMAQLPNFYKANLKSCFLVGQATGSLSAERAYIRVTKLSCVKNDGSPLVKSVQAYVTGVDGKVGLSGRVVSKQGALLARTLIAGFLKGVGEAFNESQTTISVSPLGETKSVAPDTHTILRYGIGGGVSKATEELAKFYMKMAKQMFPVIEINAGRKVDVVFLNEVKLTDSGVRR